MCGYLGSNPVHTKLDFRNQFLIAVCASASRGLIVGWLRVKFGSDRYRADKSVKFFLGILYGQVIKFSLGATFTESVMVAILDFKMAAHQNSFLTIS